MRVLRSACKHSTNTRRRHRRLTPRHMPNRQFRYRSTHSRRIEIRFCQAAIDEAAQECPHGHGRHRKVCRISLQPQSCEMDKQEMERERESARARARAGDTEEETATRRGFSRQTMHGARQIRVGTHGSTTGCTINYYCQEAPPSSMSRLVAISMADSIPSYPGASLCKVASLRCRHGIGEQQTRSQRQRETQSAPGVGSSSLFTPDS